MKKISVHGFQREVDFIDDGVEKEFYLALSLKWIESNIFDDYCS